MMELSFAEQVRTILHRKGMSIDELSNILGMSRQNFWQQMNRDNFRENDMKKIADAIDCDITIELKARETAKPEEGV